MPEISVLIPTYREALVIERSVQDLREALASAVRHGGMP